MIFRMCDIPDSLVELAMDKIAAKIGPNEPATRGEFAVAILNSAIKLGVVSPPCWAVEHGNGVLFGIFGTKTEAELNSSDDDVVRHWKGYGHE